MHERVKMTVGFVIFIGVSNVLFAPFWKYPNMMTAIRSLCHTASAIQSAESPVLSYSMHFRKLNFKRLAF